MKIKLNLLYLVPVFAFVILIPLFLFREKTIILTVNGESSSFTSKKITVKSFFSEIGLHLDPLDDLSPVINSILKNSMEINVDQAIRYMIHFDGKDFSHQSTSRTLGSILSEAEIEFDNSTQILLNGQNSTTNEILPYMAFYDISIIPDNNHSQVISENDVRQSLSVQFQDSSIDIHQNEHNHPKYELSLSGLGPQQYNFIQFSNEQDSIKYTKVSEEVVLDQYPINFSIIYQPLSTISLDSETTIQSGEFGLEAQRSRVRFEDGIETSSIIEDTWLVRSAVDRVIGYGTNVTIQTMSTPNGTIEYYRSFEFYATSYSPARSGVDPSISWYGEVYCGGYTQFGYVAVDLAYVPCGTPLYIPGYGFAIAMDTGNFDGAWIDLGYDDDNWVPWSKPVTVYFLTPVPPVESIPWIIPPGSTPFLPGFTY